MSKKNEANSNLIPVSQIKPASPGLETIRRKLAEARGPRYWRTLEEFANEKAFGDLLEREFPRQASEWLDPVSRRSFLKLAGASLALAGLAGCTKQPLEEILPYVRQPEELVPGRPIRYATAMPFAGYGIPLLAESHEYRPTKIEGNPLHPGSMGATDLFSQASILDLYDPDRATTVTYLGEARPLAEFMRQMRGSDGAIAAQKAKQGAGLQFLTGATSSPTFAAQMKAILQQFPQARWRRYDPVHRDSARAGSRLAFGAYYDPVYQFEKADVVVSLDSDFLSGAWVPGFIRYAHDWASRRKDPSKMNRLYVAESAPSTTGMKADHRLPVRPSEIEKIAGALAAKIGIGGASEGELTTEQKKWVDVVAAELGKARGRSLVVPGDFQTPTVHALAHAMNSSLGNISQTVTYIDPVEVDPVAHTQSISDLAADLKAGKVDVLVMMGVNPVYDAPADLDFAKLLKDLLDAAEKDGKKKLVHLSLYANETTSYAQWHIPQTHYLESWSDARSYEGTATIIQPLILPLYGGKSVHEILTIFTDLPTANGYEIVRGYWQGQHTGADFEQWWRKALHDGLIAGSASPARQVNASAIIPSGQSAASAVASAGGGVEVVEVAIRPDPCIYDGQFNNNAWLQETPKPLMRVTWDNVALISPAMAERFRLDQLQDQRDHQSDAQNVLDIEFQGKTIQAPYWPQPGQPDHAITLYLGYGRERTGRVGKSKGEGYKDSEVRGYNAYKVRTTSTQYAGQGAKVSLTREKEKYWSVAVTQGHFTMDDREPVKAATLAEYEKDKHFAFKNEKTKEVEREPAPNETLYRPDNYPYQDTNFNRLGYAWGMAIDLNSCIGCQTCAVACQAENNIPVVGKLQVQRGREMQWIRIDTYYVGDAANPRVYFEPVPCMQCENAPCEPVCPVGATVHSTEGLNDMVYNRCVGTRYCSNNCPYKVRRFNFLLFSDFDTPSLKMLRNPDVSVRSRGVMEKCTYCVQRISEARIASEKKENGRIEDGDIKTACQQACPTQAITFGNINDKRSAVSTLKADPRNYSLLAELNTRPRTTYIAAVRNPNHELEPEKA